MGWLVALYVFGVAGSYFACEYWDAVEGTSSAPSLTIAFFWPLIVPLMAFFYPLTWLAKRYAEERRRAEQAACAEGEEK